MPYSADHKKQSRERILLSAIDLFCRRGFDQVSIAQIMQHAEMTHGAFYAHFSSKVSLYAEAILTAGKHSLLVREGGDLDKAKMRYLVSEYLSMEHVRQEGYACPLAFLSTDVAHRDSQVRASYEKVFNGMVTRLAEALEATGKSLQTARAQAQYLVVTMVGTVSIARSLTDTESQKALLENSKTGLFAMLAD